MNIDISKLQEIKKELESLDDNDALIIDENGINKYAIMTVEAYDKVSDILEALESDSPFNTEVKVINGDQELTYEEYERVKSLIMDAVEKTFKPKAEKLN